MNELEAKSYLTKLGGGANNSDQDCVCSFYTFSTGEQII